MASQQTFQQLVQLMMITFPEHSRSLRSLLDEQFSLRRYQSILREIGKVLTPEPKLVLVNTFSVPLLVQMQFKEVTVKDRVYMDVTDLNNRTRMRLAKWKGHKLVQNNRSLILKEDLEHYIHQASMN